MSNDSVIQEIEIRGENEISGIFSRIANSGERAFSAISSAAARATQQLGAAGRAAQQASNSMARVGQQGAQSLGPLAKNTLSVNRALITLLRQAGLTSNQLRNLGANGQAAFNLLNRAVNRSSANWTTNSAITRQAISAIVNSVNQAAQVTPNVAPPAATARLQQFGAALRNTVVSVGSFVGTVGRISRSIATVGAVFGFIALRMQSSANRMRTSLQEVAAASDRQRAAQMQNLQTSLQNEQAFRDLNREFTSGAIGIEEYSQKLADLRRSQAEQAAMNRQLQAASEANAVAQARERAALQDKQRIMAMELILGPQLTSAMLRLGAAAEQLRLRIFNTFGPALANVVESISNAITTNQDKIISFLGELGAAFKPVLDEVSKSFGGILQGIISVARTAVTAFSTILLPAIRGLITALDFVAKGFNGIFGTNFTGQQILVTFLILRLTGGMGALADAARLATLGIRGLAAGFMLLIRNPIVALLTVTGVALATIAQKMGLIDIPKFVADLTGAGDATKKLGDDATQSLGQLQNQVQQLANSGGQELQQLAAAEQQVAQKAQEAAQGGQQAGQGLAGGAQQGQAAWQSFSASASSDISGLLQRLQQLERQAIAAATAVQRATGGSVGGGGARGFAGGGHIRGPGTSTSDSIPAWLSNNEYVIRARAVKKYGLAFMHAINSGRFKIPKFNMGGLVSGMTPLRPALRFAGGGHVDSSAARIPFNLVLGDRTFTGLSAPRRVADQLVAEANERRLASGGRAPSWYGNK